MTNERAWRASLCIAGCLAACAVARESEPTQKNQARVASAELAERFERNIPWGESAAQLRRSPALKESVVYGPNAVAVLPDGRPIVLDRLAGRVVVVDSVAPLRTLAAVSVDTEALAAGSDGTWLAFSPLRSRAQLFDAAGASVGELAVPRELRDTVDFEIGSSRRVRARSAHQEVIELGSPSAPLPLNVALETKREGALQLPDGRGVAVRAKDGVLHLLVVSQSADEQARSEIEKEIWLPGAFTAARVIGGRGNVVCLRTETVSSSPALSVSRRALCADALTGNVVFDEALPAPGIYTPRTELAFGAGRLAFIHPTEAGLTVTSVRVLEKEVAP